jgi:DDE superfamily endonuclease
VHQHFQKAERCVLVEDNLNTHTPAALYESFEPAKAAVSWIDWSFTSHPSMGSWLNMAEIEFSVLSRQCLSGHIPNQEFLVSVGVGNQTQYQSGYSRLAFHDCRFTYQAEEALSGRPF